MEMRRNRITVDELLEDLRAKGVTDPSQVNYAVLETNGQLSVLPFASQKPPTACQLGVNTQEQELPTILISDGRLLSENLTQLGYDDAWLQKQLKEKHCASPSNVLLLLADSTGIVYFSPKEDAL